MKGSTIKDCTLLNLPRVQTSSGSITALNNHLDIPFSIKRVYYLYDVPGGSVRGGHAHKNLYQLLVAGSGSFEVSLSDGNYSHVIALNRPNFGLLIVPGIWRELLNFSSGSICLVLASEKYQESDYIRNFKKFKEYKSLS